MKQNLFHKLNWHFSISRLEFRKAISPVRREGSMAQRGRPKMSGMIRLLRDLVVVSSYNESRRSGEKHATAIASAVLKVRSQCPGVKISETEVKRVLARYQPRGYAITWVVTKLRNGFSMGFGARPEHTRINARKCLCAAAAVK